MRTLWLLLISASALADSRSVTGAYSAIATNGSTELACARAKYSGYQRLQDNCLNWYDAARKEALSEYFVYDTKCDCKTEQNGTASCTANVRGTCTVDAERRALFGIGVASDRGLASNESLRNVGAYCYAANHETIVESSLFDCRCGPIQGQNECVCYARGVCQKPGAAVLSVGKPSVANAEEAGHPAREGNDGNKSTRWSAPDGTHGHTFRIDLGKSQQLTKANVLWEMLGVYRYRIDVSDDGVTWRLAKDRSNNNVAGQRTEDALNASGRFVRLTITGATKGGGENTWDSFYEFSVSGR